MAKFNHIQTSFKSGEVSDKFKGRRDLREYNESLEILENMVVQPTGGIIKRPGSQYVATVESASFVPGRTVPFVVSKTEAYSVVFGSNVSGEHLRIYKNDGTQATVEYTGFPNPVTTYNPKNWKYAQSGDVLVCTYSSPVSNDSDRAGADSLNTIPPVFIFRTDVGSDGDADTFSAIGWMHPSYTDLIPSNAKFSPGVYRPYRDPNVDPEIRLWVNAVAISASQGDRVLKSVDTSNTEVSYFRRGMAYTGSSTDTFGSFFKIQKGSTEGVCYLSDWRADDTLGYVGATNPIDTATNIVNFTAHGLFTGDLVELAITGSGGTEPVITGYPVDANGSFGTFYARKSGANDLYFHETLAEAKAGTNEIDFTVNGTAGIRLIYHSLSEVPCTIEVAMEGTLTSAANASDNWQESAWSAFRGFPRAVAFHEQRLFFGGNRAQPDTVWASQVGNIYNMMARRLEQDSSTPTAAASTFPGLGSYVLSGNTSATDPLSFTVASKQANVIQWLQSHNVLQIGTLGAEYVLSGGDSIISNEAIFLKKQTEYGSNNTQSLTVGDSNVFITRNGRRLRDFKFNRDNGSYISINLNVLADHMVFRGFGGASTDAYKGVEFKEIHWQQSRETLWVLTTNDELIGVTVSKESSVVAWHYHPIRSTDSIISLSVLPATSGFTDEVWMIVKRSINSVDKYYLEKIGDDFEHTVLNNTSSDDDDTAFYSDSAIKITLGSTTDTVTGLGHLEGESVNVLAGNAVEKGLTVSSGQVVLSTTYASGTVVVVGLPYTAKLRTLDLEAGGDFGTSDGNRQRIDRVAIRLYKSQGGSYKNSNASSAFDIEYDDSEVFTGVKRLDFDVTPEMDVQVEIEHDDPTPFNIISMTYRGVAYD